MEPRTLEAPLAGIGRFFVVGVSYRKTDAAVRGRFSIGPERCAALLEEAQRYGLGELFALSTCNRTELYALAGSAEALLRAMAGITGQDMEDLRALAYVRKEEDAVRHLFKVASGLDSQLLGDYEIVGQIKAAVRFSKERGGTGPFIERLANEALKVSKAIKNNTSISTGTVSVSFAAVRYLEQVPDIAGRRVLVVGAGKMGRSACLHLVEHLGCRDVTLINRSPERALALAERLGVRARPFEELGEALAEADVVLAATNAPAPIITAANVGSNRPQWILDLGMPGNVHSEVAALPGKTLLNVDEISHLTDGTLRQRRAQVPMALALIEEAVAEFSEWSLVRERLGVLADVKRTLGSIHAKGAVPGSAPDANTSERMRHALKRVAVGMREGNDRGCQYLMAINLFITGSAPVPVAGRTDRDAPSTSAKGRRPRDRAALRS